MNIYIAGPMRSKPEFNFPAFFEAAEWLSSLGLNPINPAEFDVDRGFDPRSGRGQLVTPEFIADAIRRDVGLILDEAEGILMLPGWTESIGASAEYALARWKELPVFKRDGDLLVGEETIGPLDMEYSEEKKQKFTPDPVVNTSVPKGDHLFNANWPFTDPSVEEEEDVLEEALRLTRGDRQNQYGPPDQDFRRTADMWTALKGVKFEPKDVAMFTICMKLSRETHQKKRDNWVDIAGYARCGHICAEAAAQREVEQDEEWNYCRINRGAE